MGINLLRTEKVLILNLGGESAATSDLGIV